MINSSTVAGLRRSGSVGIPLISSEPTNIRPVYSSGLSIPSILHSYSTNGNFPGSGVVSFFAVQFASSSINSVPFIRFTTIVILSSFFIGWETKP